MIKIRMARGGRKHTPVFSIVAIESRSARDGKFLQKLGQYNPKANPELTMVKAEELKNWIKKGAQVSTTVATLLKKNNIKLA
jgi:small subunit ribosomal protein S16